MSAGPWWMDPDKVIPPPLFPAVKKPPQFDREHLKLPPDLLEQINAENEPLRLLQAYQLGIVRAAQERLERATEASVTDPAGRGVLEFWRVDGLDVSHGVWLHPDVPYGHRWRVDGGALRSLITLEAFVNDYPGLSDGSATLIE